MSEMIDLNRVSELREEIGAADFDEVVEMFIEEADEVVARLFLNSDAKSTEAAMHFLKGAALNLGFSALAALCQEGEHRAGSGDTDIDTDAVKQCYELSKSAFAKDGTCADAA